MPTALKGRDEVNIVWKTLRDNFDAETQKVIYEDENRIHVHFHYKLKSIDVFYSVTQTVTIKYGRISHHHGECENLEHLSEMQSWTWLDVRCFS